MNVKKELFVVRHGQTLWNIEGRMQGRLDSPLSEEGQRQAGRHAEVLHRLGGVDHMLCSPSGRTRETASLLNAKLAVPIDYEEVLMERDCGDWSGLTIEEITSGADRLISIGRIELDEDIITEADLELAAVRHGLGEARTGH